MTPEILNHVPWQAPMPDFPQLLLIALSATVLVLAVWYVVKEIRRRKDLVPLYMFIGAGMAVMYEPLGDILASVLYPVRNQIGWISLFGRDVPMFIGLLYFWYMSVPAIYFLAKVEEGLTRKSLWNMYLFSLVLAIAIELFGVNVDAWIYYGPHPYVIYGVPLWCPATYSGFLVVISLGCYGLVKSLPKKHQWLLIPAVPLLMAGGHCALALPTSAAMFTTTSPFWIWLGGTVSIALGFLLVYLASILCCVDNKVQSSSKAVVA